MDVAYVVGLEARGLSPHARRVMESGEVACVEWTNYTLAVRFKAAAMGVPFLPARSMLGTDTFRHSAARVIACPFTGERLVALPALYPDVAAIHVHEADRYGNCRIRGTTVADLDLARAARSSSSPANASSPTTRFAAIPTAPSFRSSAWTPSAKCPTAAIPATCRTNTSPTRRTCAAGWRWSATRRNCERSWRNMIYGVRDFAEYLHKCGGLPRLQELRRQEFLLHQGR